MFISQMLQLVIQPNLAVIKLPQTSDPDEFVELIPPSQSLLLSD